MKNQIIMALGLYSLSQFLFLEPRKLAANIEEGVPIPHWQPELAKLKNALQKAQQERDQARNDSRELHRQLQVKKTELEQESLEKRLGSLEQLMKEHLVNKEATVQLKTPKQFQDYVDIETANPKDMSVEKVGGNPDPNSREIVIERKKPGELNLPTPIMVMGMMKAGTTSIYSYFKCGMDLNFAKLSHYDCKPGKDPLGINMACGRKLYGNVMAQRHPFDDMDQFHLYAELDANSGSALYLPQYTYLQEIYYAYPNATWILNLRDPPKWLSSIDRWEGLRQRFIKSNLKPDLPVRGRSKPGERPTGEKDEDMINFYNRQAQRVRDFVRDHPSLHLVEVQIDKPNAGEIMEDAFGISRQCWGNKNVNKGDAVWTEH